MGTGGAWIERSRLAVFAGALLLAACARNDAAQFHREERRQFQFVMESKLRQLDRRIARLAGAATAPDSSYAGDVEKLKRSQLTLRDRLSAMDAATDAQWPALRDSVESTYHDVRQRCGFLAQRDAGAGTAADAGYAPAQSR